MSELKRVKLEDVIHSANTGLDAIKRAPIVEQDTGIKCLRIQDISQEKKYPDWGYCEVSDKNYNRFSLKESDIIIARTGATVGVNRYIHKNLKAVYNNGLIRLRAKKDICLPKYLYYQLQSYEYWGHINGVALSTSTQPNMRINGLLSFKFDLPDIDEQNKIASILSAFDDLIENNTRRIAILEETARLIYREWFVHYRYPGHEDDRLVDSGTDLGDVPEGWEVVKLEDILDHYIGGGWGKEEPMEKFPDPAYVIRGTDIPGAKKGDISDVPFRYHKISNLKSRKLKDGDIVFEASGGSKGQPLGRSLLITNKLLSEFDSEVMCASFCKLMRVNKEITLPELLYLEILEMYDDRRIMKYQVQSTGISNFKFSFFLEDLSVLIPPKELRDKFAKIVRPLFTKMHLLGKKNTRLKETRDLLLPKLISGKEEV